MPVFHRILVATDFGEPSQRAAAVATQLAQAIDASLVLVHAYEVPGSAYAGMEFAPVDFVAAIADAARQMLDAELTKARLTVPGATALLKQGIVWREIIEAIGETRADLVVVGTQGRRGIAHAFLGSVAEKIVRMSPVPVLTVRAADVAAG